MVLRAMQSDRLSIRNFAQIGEIDLDFGDLTVLVGAQGTGKSLALQWLKVAVDGRQLVEALSEAGYPSDRQDVLIDFIFGSGMAGAWKTNTAIRFGGKAIDPARLTKIGDGSEKLFFIPAHRSMLISDGWAAPFQKISSDTPVVARIFSQNLFERFRGKGEGPLFPVARILKREYRDLIDKAVFHKGVVGIEEDREHKRRLRLSHGSMHLPFMTWTAGQREFTPLMLGLYHLLPPRKEIKNPTIEWVVIEEPEMGLHPQAITAVILLVLDLLWRGYKVALSTHSPHVVTAVWMMQLLKAHHARPRLVADAFGIPESAQIKSVARAALQKEYRVHHMYYGADGKVVAKDITSLDPGAEDERIAGWGGLTEFSSRFGDAVRKAVNEGE